jgi:hypothetical protein
MKMRSVQRGKPTSAAEVTNISVSGLWILIDEREIFLPFTKFPWFREATVAQLTHVRRPSEHHLYWPDLDVDLAVESLEHPDRFPLVSRERPKSAPPAPTAAPRRARSSKRTVRPGTR